MVNIFIYRKVKDNPFKLYNDVYGVGFEKVKKFADSDKGSGFYMFYYRKLDYVVPLAIQAPIVVSIDLEGNIENKPDSHREIEDSPEQRPSNFKSDFLEDISYHAQVVYKRFLNAH